MSRRHSRNKDMEKLVGDIGPGDGVDPRDEQKEPSAPRFGRKAMQLCKQVQRTLSYALSECEDDVVTDLFVESVTPAPDETRLLVTVSPLREDLDPITALQHLHLNLKFLRAEVAQGIHRRKVPELTFHCQPKEQ